MDLVLGGYLRSSFQVGMDTGRQTPFVQGMALVSPQSSDTAVVPAAPQFSPQGKALACQRTSQQGTAPQPVQSPDMRNGQILCWLGLFL